MATEAYLLDLQRRLERARDRIEMLSRQRRQFALAAFRGDPTAKRGADVLERDLKAAEIDCGYLLAALEEATS